MSSDKHTSDGGSTTYYDIPEGVKDLQDLIEQKNMNFSIGNIFKACYRLGQKSGQDDLYDVNKILFFAKREKKRLEKKIDKTEKAAISNSTWYCNTSGVLPFEDDLEQYMIQYKLRNGQVTTASGSRIAELRWELRGNDYDIIEYRIV
jgi:hypothetical protein